VLGQLAEDENGAAFSAATAINDRGQVVGFSRSGPFLDFAAPDSTAFLWQPADLPHVGPGQMQALSAPADLTVIGTVANDINAGGTVVGVLYVAPPPGGAPESRAFVWIPESPNGPTGEMFDLNLCIPAATGWRLLRANAINAAGQITGLGIDPSGNTRAILLTRLVRTATTLVVSSPAPAHLNAQAGGNGNGGGNGSGGHPVMLTATLRKATSGGAQPLARKSVTLVVLPAGVDPNAAGAILAQGTGVTSDGGVVRVQVRIPFGTPAGSYDIYGIFAGDSEFEPVTSKGAAPLVIR
jgi:probable HAF family extracellular repeat protein